jgi:hypothetical protein
VHGRCEDRAQRESLVLNIALAYVVALPLSGVCGAILGAIRWVRAVVAGREPNPNFISFLVECPSIVGLLGALLALWVATEYMLRELKKKK